MDKNRTNETHGLCPVCTYPMDKCVCCAECKVVYPDVDHAFHNDTGPHYYAQAA